MIPPYSGENFYTWLLCLRMLQFISFAFYNKLPWDIRHFFGNSFWMHHLVPWVMPQSAHLLPPDGFWQRKHSSLQRWEISQNVIQDQDAWYFAYVEEDVWYFVLVVRRSLLNNLKSSWSFPSLPPSLRPPAPSRRRRPWPSGPWRPSCPTWTPSPSC